MSARGTKETLVKPLLEIQLLLFIYSLRFISLCFASFHLDASNSWKASTRQQLEENYDKGMGLKRAFKRQFGSPSAFQSVKEQARYLLLSPPNSPFTHTQVLTQNSLELRRLEQRKGPAGWQQLPTAFSCPWALTYLQKDTLQLPARK